MQKIVKIEELTVLLNQIRSFLIYVPLIKAELFKVELEEREAEIKCALRGRNDYQNITTQFSASQEFPDYSDYSGAFQQAGLTPIENEDEIKKYFEEATGQDLLMGGDRYFFGFDNNVLRNRIFTNLFMPIPEFKTNWGYLLSPYVRYELEDRGKKYDYHKPLQKISKEGWIIDVFRNQPKLAERKRSIGFTEFQKIRNLRQSNTQVLNAKITKTETLKEGLLSYMDNFIVDDYANFVKAGMKIILLSADKRFIGSAKGRDNIISVLVDYDRRPQKDYTCSREKVTDFLYALSVLYGRIELQTVQSEPLLWIDGIWAGKGPDNWTKEQLKVTTCPDSSLSKETREAIEADLNIIHAFGNNS